MTASDIKRTCGRSVVTLAAGVAAYIAFHKAVADWIGGFVAIAVVVAAYGPMTRLRCPHCGRFPLKGWLNIGPLPFLYFVSSERCRNCSQDIFAANRGGVDVR
jgi:hypothetical protein